MSILVKTLAKLGIHKADLDYHLIRARWWSSISFLDIENGSITRQKPLFLFLRMGLL